MSVKRFCHRDSSSKRGFTCQSGVLISRVVFAGDLAAASPESQAVRAEWRECARHTVTSFRRAAMAHPSSFAPPNLLLIVTDHQAHSTLAAYGNDRIQVPRMNALAELSTVFNRAYCAQPMCGPARACLFHRHLAALQPPSPGYRAGLDIAPGMRQDTFVSSREYHGRWRYGRPA